MELFYGFWGIHDWREETLVTFIALKCQPKENSKERRSSILLHIPFKSIGQESRVVWQLAEISCIHSQGRVGGAKEKFLWLNCVRKLGGGGGGKEKGEKGVSIQYSCVPLGSCYCYYFSSRRATWDTFLLCLITFFKTGRKRDYTGPVFLLHYYYFYREAKGEDSHGYSQQQCSTLSHLVTFIIADIILFSRL